MSEQHKTAFLGRDALFPLLVRMSVPAMIGMMVTSMYNIADTIFIGRGAGTLAIAGLSIAFPIQMIAQSVSRMIGVGGASVISRRLGEKDYDGASSALGTAFTVNAVATVILMALFMIFTVPVLRLFGASDASLPYAREYLRTVIWGFPFIAVSVTGNNLIRAEGNARVAMFTMLIGMVLNIILDPVFIFIFNMGIRGAAVATVISQACSSLWVLLYYGGRRSVVAVRRRFFRIGNELAREILVLGTPNFVQSAGMSVLTMIINNILLTAGGDMAISAYGIVHRLLSFIIMPVIGLSQGFQPIAGFNYGARKFDRVRKILLVTTVSAVCVSGFFYVIIRLFPNHIIGMFTTDAALVKMSVDAMLLMNLLMPVGCLQMVFSVYFQAVGKGIHSLLLGLSRQFLILIPIVLILPRFIGLAGVWGAFPLSDALSTVITAVILVFELRHLDSRHRDTQAEAQRVMVGDA